MAQRHKKHLINLARGAAGSAAAFCFAVEDRYAIGDYIASDSGAKIIWYRGAWALDLYRQAQKLDEIALAEQAMAAAEAAGGFGDAKAWNAEMLKQALKLEKDGKLWLRYGIWQHGEVEAVTGLHYPHTARFDLTAPYDDAQPSMVVVQWKEDGSVGVVYPFEYANTEFELPSWGK